jgi:hypothetical protein
MIGKHPYASQYCPICCLRVLVLGSLFLPASLFSHAVVSKPSANQLHSYAMFELAENLLRGQYVPPDPVGAVQFLEQATSLGHVIATWTLGQLLIKGCDGVPRDTKRGIAMVSAALKADPSISKKVFVPYTNPVADAVASPSMQPVSPATPMVEAAVKADVSPLRSPSRLQLYGAAFVGVALVVSLLVSRMRRK